MVKEGVHTRVSPKVRWRFGGSFETLIICTSTREKKVGQTNYVPMWGNWLLS